MPALPRLQLRAVAASDLSRVCPTGGAVTVAPRRRAARLPPGWRSGQCSASATPRRQVCHLLRSGAPRSAVVARPEARTLRASSLADDMNSMSSIYLFMSSGSDAPSLQPRGWSVDLGRPATTPRHLKAAGAAGIGERQACVCGGGLGRDRRAAGACAWGGAGPGDQRLESFPAFLVTPQGSSQHRVGRRGSGRPAPGPPPAAHRTRPSLHKEGPDNSSNTETAPFQWPADRGRARPLPPGPRGPIRPRRSRSTAEPGHGTGSDIRVHGPGPVSGRMDRAWPILSEQPHPSLRSRAVPPPQPTQPVPRASGTTPRPGPAARPARGARRAPGPAPQTRSGPAVTRRDGDEDTESCPGRRTQLPPRRPASSILPPSPTRPTVPSRVRVGPVPPTRKTGRERPDTTTRGAARGLSRGGPVPRAPERPPPPPPPGRPSHGGRPEQNRIRHCSPPDRGRSCSPRSGRPGSISARTRRACQAAGPTPQPCLRAGPLRAR